MPLFSPMYTKDTRVDGKVVVITGANTGIGKETVRDLYKRGAHIIVGVRSVEKGETARAEVISGGGSGAVVVYHLDLASMASVKRFARAVNEAVRRIDLLINNAGVMACPRAETRDGFESQLGVNHLGHFLLTLLLLDKLKTTAKARIINLTSAAHGFGRMHFDDIMLQHNYSPWGAYGQSKLANILFTRELARRLAGTGVTAYAVHPGMVNTELWRHLPWYQYIWLKIQLAVVHKTPVQGAQTTLYCALDPDLAEVSGKYYADCKELLPSQYAQNDDDARKLWTVSCDLLDLPKFK